MFKSLDDFYQAAAGKVEYYYDHHLTREDLLTGWEYPFHSLYALLDTLKWLYRNEGGWIAHKINIYQTSDPTEVPLAPEIAVFKGLALSPTQQLDIKYKSWPLPIGLPAPNVVFEFTAKPAWQWQHTLAVKPGLYAQMGVKEMFAYDGLDSWRPKGGPHLRGWTLNGSEPGPIEPDARGWLWSAELGSWLSGDQNWLLLYDETGQERPTEFQALELAQGNHWFKNGMWLDEKERRAAQRQARIKTQTFPNSDQPVSEES